MKTLLIICTLLSIMDLNMSAKGLSGTILDKTLKLPIEYANVLILDKDSLYINGCTTDTQGSFVLDNIPANAKYIKISFVGYEDAFYDMDNIDASSSNIFYIQQTNVALGEVVVSANSKPFKVKDDKIIFNPLFAAHALNANEIVKQAPGVMDTGNSLIMPGKSGIKVLINGKEQKGTLNDALLLLKSYPASDVESVEILTNPPTRYTLGNNVGLIHVKLKKKVDDYLGGNASYGISHDGKVSHESTIGVFYQGKRFSTSINASGNLKEYRLKENNNINFSNYTRYTTTYMNRNADDFVLKWNANYQFNKKWDAGLSAFYAYGKLKQYTSQNYLYDFIDEYNVNKLVDGNRTDKAKTWLTSFDLNGRLSKATTLTMNVDYYYKSSPTDRNLYDIESNELIIQALNDIASKNITAKTNLSIIPNTKLSLNFGMDCIFTNSENFEDGIYEEQINSQSRFKYEENELDIYGEARYKFNSNWMLRGSLRYQSVWTEAKIASEYVQNKHFNVFCPSAFLSYLFKNDQSVQLGFYYNINRPTLTALNPTRLYIGNDTYRQGNPFLEHSRHYVVNFTYSIGGIMIQPYVEWLDKGITEISILEDDKYQIMTWENAVDRRNIGVMIFGSYSKKKWMRASFTAFLSNPVTTSDHSLLKPKVSSFKFSINPNLQFYFDQKHKWVLSVYGNYTSPEHTVDIKMKSLWTFSSRLAWKPDSHWALAITGLDLLHSKTRGTQYIGDSVMKFSNQYAYTGVQFSLSYAFGKSMRRVVDSATLKNMNSRTGLD